jgi:Flp pilus assembly protein TadG
MNWAHIVDRIRYQLKIGFVRETFTQNENAKTMKRSEVALQSFLRNTAASTAMVFSLSLPALLGSAGLAVDFSIYNLKQTKLQSAADQAAVAAAKELTVVNVKKSAIAEAADGFARNILTSGNFTVNAEVGAANDTVKVTITEVWTPFFAQFIGADVTPVVARATAKLAGTANVCVLALNGTAAKAVHMDKQARLQATGCGVYSNSSHTQSIRLDQNSEMKAALVCAVGGVKAKTTAVSPSPTTDCAVLSDPLASRKAPSATGCAATNLVLKSGSTVLDPGTYCGGIKVTASATATFRPGTYIIKDGVFEVSGDGSVISNNAAFYLQGEASLLSFTGNSTLEMTGATSGELAGLLFFEDRSTSMGRTHRINSANARKLTGTIYLPNGKLRIDPNTSVAQDSAYTAIIANEVEIDEGPLLVLNSDYGSSNVPVPDGIRLSTQVVLSE